MSSLNIRLVYLVLLRDMIVSEYCKAWYCVVIQIQRKENYHRSLQSSKSKLKFITLHVSAHL